MSNQLSRVENPLKTQWGKLKRLSLAMLSDTVGDIDARLYMQAARIPG